MFDTGVDSVKMISPVTLLELRIDPILISRLKLIVLQVFSFFFFYPASLSPALCCYLGRVVETSFERRERRTIGSGILLKGAIFIERNFFAFCSFLQLAFIFIKKEIIFFYRRERGTIGLEIFLKM